MSMIYPGGQLNIVDNVDSTSDSEQFTQQYLGSVKLIERLHRLLLEVIKDEFDRDGTDEVNPVQALLLFNLGDQEVTASELKSRGYYLGSNVSYNLKKLVANGFIDQQRSAADKRSVRIRLTDKGHDIRQRVGDLFNRQIDRMVQTNMMTNEESRILCSSLEKVERLWSDQIRFRL